MLRAPLILIIAVALAGCGSATPAARSTATAAPKASADPRDATKDRLQAALVKDLEHWLTANTDAGVTAELSGVTCDYIGESQFKCKATGMLKDDSGTTESGHMTVVATVKDERYTWEPVEFWTADGS